MHLTHGVEIVGPFQERELVVDGWSVPFVNPIELDGGRVELVIDRRFGFGVAASEFEEVARLLATSIAVALGLPCRPQGDLSPESQMELFRRVTVHRALLPRRVVHITGVRLEDAAGPPDDPRDMGA